MMAEVPVRLPAVTPVITGAEVTGGVVTGGVTEPPPVQVRTVIEYGAKESAADGLKLAIVFVTGEITIADSFVSVRLADVSRVRCTLPEGALTPLKVTGRAAVRCRLKTTSELWDPLEKAKDCR